MFGMLHWSLDDLALLAYRTAIQHCCDAQIRECNSGGLIEPDCFAVHKAKEGEHGSRDRKSGSLVKLAINNKGCGGPENQAAKDGTAADH